MIKLDLNPAYQQSPTMEEPKPRPITLEAHVLAYLGDLMTLFEESIKRLAQQEISKRAECSAPSALTLDGSAPGDPKYTASAPSRS